MARANASVVLACRDESKCALAAKMLRLTGVLPAGMPVQRWEKCRKDGKNFGETDVARMARASASEGNAASARRGQRKGLVARGFYGNEDLLKGRGPGGSGQPGQWTRWGGFG